MHNNQSFLSSLRSHSPVHVGYSNYGWNEIVLVFKTKWFARTQCVAICNIIPLRRLTAVGLFSDFIILSSIDRYTTQEATPYIPRIYIERMASMMNNHPVMMKQERLTCCTIKKKWTRVYSSFRDRGWPFCFHLRIDPTQEGTPSRKELHVSH